MKIGRVGGAYLLQGDQGRPLIRGHLPKDLKEGSKQALYIFGGRAFQKVRKLLCCWTGRSKRQSGRRWHRSVRCWALGVEGKTLNFLRKTASHRRVLSKV